ncbi:hypothetical protein CLOAM1775 [Candidatus Cloacimonas acidaminovorans str. Evry]|uniref:Uncharacterized protein n=1 Tax=Cloacimonas acidaminovorans (strain Evry) TaxID=459349 RepID=B0VJT8_CLOAI|nr:hypothetical protein CLOAM1775 [Candidatus Cloacimonas acidaminovorans str. Evry]
MIKREFGKFITAPISNFGNLCITPLIKEIFLLFGHFLSFGTPQSFVSVLNFS